MQLLQNLEFLDGDLSLNQTTKHLNRHTSASKKNVKRKQQDELNCSFEGLSN